MLAPPPNNETYASLEAAETAVYQHARSEGYAVRRDRSKKSKTGITRKVYLGCAHGGTYHNKRTYLTEETRKRKTTTRATGCPFAVILLRHVAKENGEQVTWDVTVKNEEHNHPAAHDPSMYPTLRKLKVEEKEIISSMSEAGEAPKAILATLRQRDPSCTLIPRDIYNEKAQIRNRKLDGRTPLEMLLHDLQTDGVLHAYERDTEGRMTRLFFAPPKSAKLAREFPDVMLLNSTYKSNRFKLPLLHMAGITSTNQTFSGAFCFLNAETEEDYTWALEHLCSVFAPNQLPTVIVTDCKLALIAAIRSSMPNVTNLLCKWHISENILSNCCNDFRSEEDRGNFQKDWDGLVVSIDEVTFNTKWKVLREKYPHSTCNYIDATWMPHKEKFVTAWTKTVRHFDNLVTSRVAEKHSPTKGWIAMSSGNLTDVYKRLMLAVDQQDATIRRRIAYDRLNTQLRQHSNFWAEVQREISHFALNLVHNQLQKAQHFGTIVAPCTNTFTTTMGLPCAHKIRKILATNTGLRMEDFYQHWWLDKPQQEDADGKENAAPLSQIDTALQQVRQRYDQLPSDQQRLLLEQLMLLSQERPPEPAPTRGRGRPRGSRNRHATGENAERPQRQQGRRR